MKNFEKFCYVFILIAIIIGLYLRIVNPWNSVFVPWMDGARLSGNDPWYYFRLVETTLHNFPNRIWFDAFTNYPHGTYTHFGPFLVYLSAILAKIFNATTSVEIINVIAFIPAVAGSLLPIPVYIFASSIFNKRVGVIAALLVVIIPGQLMSRSVLSFNDHHIWEVIWQTMTFALFVYSIKKWDAPLNEILKNKKSFIYPILCGIFLALYILTWGPGFIAVLFVLVYVFIVYLLRDYLKVKTKNLTILSVVALLTAAVIYSPFSFAYPGLNTICYSPFQLLVLISSAVVIILFYLTENFVKKVYLRVNERVAFPLAIILITGVITAVISIISPDFLNYILSIIRVVQPTGGALTIAEVQPFFTMGGSFTLLPAWQNFSMTFFFAIPGMIYVLYKFLKEREKFYLFSLIWGFALLVALVGQNRFAYYFGVVSAVFAAVTLDAILTKFDFYEYLKTYLTKTKSKKKVSTTKVITSVLAVLLLFYPTFTQANTYSKYSVGGINQQWFEALMWMRNNTPDGDFYDGFYYELYKPVPPGDRYPYPEEVYSIISWWDYGHWITAIAHRIPVANPFQQGIGNKYNNVPGAAPFFTAFNESYADEIAKKLDVKYVVSDIEMATGKFYAMAVWAEGSLEKAHQIYYRGYGIVYQDINGNIGISLSGRIPMGAQPIMGMNIPSENYYETMEARLHIFDGDSLKHYRMVFESGAAAGYFGFLEMLHKLVYNNLYAGERINITTSGYVKIFERVEGAVVTGNASGEYVVAKVTIKTNQGRLFEYTQKVDVIDGKYTLILPYAQNTTYPTKPVEPYTIKCGDVTKSITLEDEDVVNGSVIHLDLT
uniref:dolichyl-phosphooligosaccharide-protein glycotransferase n=1 Tax=Geoglobus ahangari TaxID=113653 RepID=A0A7C3UB62_9EURY